MSDLHFTSLNKGKSTHCLETEYISDVTSKVVSRNSLNEEKNKEKVKNVSECSLNVPYLRESGMVG